MEFLILVGSVALLMYGMKVMSEGLQKMAGSRLRTVLSTMTTNRFTGLLTGAFITTSIQSSTATTVMTVSFVSAGLLSLSQAISVIMGANIGTTATAWIMVLGGSFDMRMMVYAGIIAAIALIYTKKNVNVGEFLMGLSLMLLGLTTLKVNAADMHLDQNVHIQNFLQSVSGWGFGSYLLFLVIGGLLTCAVQSSAAIMAITMTLCSTGVLDIYLGIALVMGENVGTTITSNIVAMSANTQAQRAARAHLIFNLFGVIWVLCIYTHFVNFVCSLVGCDPEHVENPVILNVVLAAFHTAFNVCNVLILIWFIKPMEKIVCMLVPQKEGQDEVEEGRLKYIGGGLLSTAELSIFEASMEVEIANYLHKVSEGRLSSESKTQIQCMLRMISELESIGDSCYNLGRTINRLHMHSKERFSDEQTKHIHTMVSLVSHALEAMVNVVEKAPEHQYADYNVSYNIEHEINNYRNQLKNQNLQDINDGLYSYQIGVYYMDFISECEKLGDYVVNVVQATK